MFYREPQIIVMISVPIMYVIIVMFWIFWGITPEAIVDFIAKKLAQKAHLTKIDFEKTKKEYKDILYNYSITELSYIDNFEINLKKEIVSTLLNLELKNKIRIMNEKIEIINDDDTDLKLTEKDVFHWIEDGKVRIQNAKIYEEKMRQDALNEGIETGFLCKMNEGIKQQKKLKYILSFIICNIIAILMMLKCFHAITFEYNSEKISLIAAYIYSGIFTVLVPIYTIFIGLFIEIFREYDKKMRYTYERTSYGNSINEKIEGLKRYIKEYSLLDEKEKQALIVWDEYLIYSVEFNQNKKVLKNMSKLIEDEPSKKFITKKEIIPAVIVCAIYMICGVLWKQYSEAILAILAFAVAIFLINHGKKR